MSKEAMKLALEALKYPLNQSHENFNVDMAELLAHRAITALREALAEQPAQQDQGWKADVQKVRDALDPEDWCGDERMIDVLDRALAQKPCCSNMAAGTSCLADPNPNCPMLAAPQPAQQEPLTPAQKIALAEDWFAEDWAITKAVGMMVEYEMRIAHGITKGTK